MEDLIEENTGKSIVVELAENIVAAMTMKATIDSHMTTVIRIILEVAEAAVTTMTGAIRETLAQETWEASGITKVRLPLVVNKAWMRKNAEKSVNYSTE